MCYGPYKQDSTDTQTGSKTAQDQCAGCGTDGTSGTMERGVTESRNHARTERTHVLTYLRTKRTDVPNFTMEEFMYLKTAVLTFK